MIWEIILVTVGIAAVAAGYLIPAGKDNKEETADTLSKEMVQNMVEEQVEAAKDQITDIVDETITYAMEKTERSMDRLSNEKMMAVSEYSDTVLEQINKSHEEVVFLYDMLTDKHDSLKDTVAEASKAASEVKASIKEAEEFTPVVAVAPIAEVEVSEEKTEKKAKKKTAKQDNSVKPVPVIKAINIPETLNEDNDFEEEDNFEEEWDDFEMDDEDDFSEGPEISFIARTPGNRNSNERILELHKAGKSNMAIAKELGLGVGEVKLVIELFKGQA